MTLKLHWHFGYQCCACCFASQHTTQMFCFDSITKFNSCSAGSHCIYNPVFFVFFYCLINQPHMCLNLFLSALLVCSVWNEHVIIKKSPIFIAFNLARCSYLCICWPLELGCIFTILKQWRFSNLKMSQSHGETGPVFFYDPCEPVNLHNWNWARPILRPSRQIH